MAFDDIKEQISDRAQALWGRLQENSSFVQLTEQYQALPPNGQKAVLAGVSALFALILFLIPYSFYASSASKVDAFEANKTLIEDLFSVRRDSSILKAAPARMDQNTLISLAQGKVGEAGVPPERVRVDAFDNKLGGRSSSVIPSNVQQLGASVTVTMLNLTQLVDIGYALETISTGVKMMAMEAHAAAKDPRYFDVTYRLAHFSIPEPETKAETKARIGHGNKRPSKPAKNGNDE